MASIEPDLHRTAAVLIVTDRGEEENEDGAVAGTNANASENEDEQMEVESVESDVSAAINPTVDERDNGSERTEDESLMESHNSTPQIVRTLQVLNQARESPDEFKLKEARGKKRSKPSSRADPLSPEKEDDAQCCPICFENWTNSGSHRLASLNCGHLFGRSCIERWLKSRGNEKCPQCNAPARKKDIRNIYAKAIRTIDTTERDQALLELDRERQARKQAEEAEARALLQYQLVKAECERIKVQFQLQQEMLLKNQSSQSSSSVSTSQPSCIRTHGESSCDVPQRSYVLQRSFQVAQSGARIMAFDSHHATLVVSKPSPNQLFPGYGVVKVSSLDLKHCEFVRIHQKPVRDAAFSRRGDGLLLTAGMDKTVRITSLLSNTIVQTYEVPVPAWSCAWNSSDTNYVYCGLQNGACLIFDVRNTSTYLKSLQSENRGSCPVVSLASVEPSTSSKLRPGGILVCKLEGACFWENTFGADYLRHQLTLPEGSCTSLSFEPNTRHCMFSLRPSKNFPKTRHVVCQMQGKGIAISTARGRAENTENASNNQPTDSTTAEGSPCVCNPVTQCTGGRSQKLLNRSILFSNPDDANKLLACAGDESSNSTLVWDASSGLQLQKLPNQGSAVLDVIPFTVNGEDFLTTVNDQKLTIYRRQ